MRNILLSVPTALLLLCACNNPQAQSKNGEQTKESTATESKEFVYTPKFQGFIIIQPVDDLNKNKEVQPYYKFISTGTLTNTGKNFYQEGHVGEKIVLYDTNSKIIQVKLNMGMAGFAIDYSSLKPGETKKNLDWPAYMFSDFKPEYLDFPVSKVVLEQYVQAKDLQGPNKQMLIKKEDITAQWKDFIARKNEKKADITFGYWKKDIETAIREFIEKHK